ncbi:hypothetical protein [Bradyrhizobium elkanii]|uniref:hypothetical protein n=1 Tax=Bradyrhizobium elkanii TaxID=29448 RepID=UPI001FD9E946|nr:hypothetical protein [Bradyrhizobium elkanii]MBP2426977.1 hypothetical protein [Bradyrhizobium elkanii]WLA95275.1 hypothetical protein QNJ96_19255 [Bradyrhizobium elkanii]
MKIKSIKIQRFKRLEPFVTSEIDVEGYFSTPEYLRAILTGIDVDELFKDLLRGEENDLISAFVNGRIDFERKRGTIGNLNHGALSVQAKEAVDQNPLSIMKGKRRLAKLRRIVKEKHGVQLPIDSHPNKPSDANLEILAKKLFPKQATFSSPLTKKIKPKKLKK